MENNQDIPDSDVEDYAEATGHGPTATAADESIEEKVKRELQCPVCDKIPTTLPIPTCSMGHIVCRDCKNKINLEIGRKPCPICRSPLPHDRDDSNSHVVGSLISLLSDIPCSFKDNGCSFEGSIEDHKAHRYACKFRMVECLNCFEECTLKDFVAHNSRNCFLTSPTNTFNFPERNSLYLVQVNTEEELLEVVVEAVEAVEVDDAAINGKIDFFWFNFYSLADSSKIKIKTEDPLFQMEATGKLDAGSYLVLGAKSGVGAITFEIIKQ